MKRLAVALQQQAGGFRDGVSAITAWPLRRWLVATAVGTLAALASGVPTGVVPTSFYTRMTPVTWWNYPVWAISAVLVGLIVASYVRDPARDAPVRLRAGRAAGATLLTTFAVGCPICNKLVVGLIGVSGALNYWAPLQPALGVLSIGLLAAGLAVRLRGTGSCPIQASV